jgi:hypothetical protein
MVPPHIAHRARVPLVRRRHALGLSWRPAQPGEGGPHAIAWTHTLQVNNALLQFIGAEARVTAG